MLNLWLSSADEYFPTVTLSTQTMIVIRPRIYGVSSRDALAQRCLMLEKRAEYYRTLTQVPSALSALLRG